MDEGDLDVIEREFIYFDDERDGRVKKVFDFDILREKNNVDQHNYDLLYKFNFLS